VITAGAVEVNQGADTAAVPKTNAPAKISAASAHRGPLALAPRQVAPAPAEPVELAVAPAPQPAAADPAPVPAEEPAPVADSTGGTEAAAQPAAEGGNDSKATAKARAPKLTAAKSPTPAAGAPTGAETVVVTVGGSTPPAEEASTPPADASPPPAESTPPSEPPATQPPAESTPPPPPPSSSGSSEGGEAEAPAAPTEAGAAPAAGETD
jgi:nicotinate-nucleotide--dimethylbenzimidazole phosphoribosyltransferase